MERLKQRILELIYPTKCPFCGKIHKEGICEDCREKIVVVKEPRCKKCGKPIRQEEEEFCYDCRTNPKKFEQGKSLWLHRMPVSNGIYRFKYKNRKSYGRFFAAEMYREYGTWMLNAGIDCIVPVPLHRSRRRYRGYNQAEILAKELGRLSGIRVDVDCIVRDKKTIAQKKLDDRQRRRNLKKAFRVTEDMSDVKNLLIIDDIYTTGSTIEAMTEQFLKAGVEKVWFLTISIGQGF